MHESILFTIMFYKNDIIIISYNTHNNTKTKTITITKNEKEININIKVNINIRIIFPTYSIEGNKIVTSSAFRCRVDWQQQQQRSEKDHLICTNCRCAFISLFFLLYFKVKKEKKNKIKLILNNQQNTTFVMA